MTKKEEILKRFRERFVVTPQPRGVSGQIVPIQQVRATPEELESFLSSVVDEGEGDEYRAYCNCGDALDRTGLYPNEAIYYCSGCDRTYGLKLIASKKEPNP